MNAPGRQRFWLTNRIANPVLRRLLRSPLATRFGRRLAVLRYTGHLSGKTYELIVQCARAGHTIWIVPGQHERKTWWRNFRTPRRVDLWLAGKQLHGQAIVIDGHADPAEAARGLTAYLPVFPQAGRALNIDGANGAVTPSQARRAILVRFTLDDKT
jgi:hypothetical protein